MSHEFPRRRDVRDMAEELLHTLMWHYDNDAEEFDQDFLTDVRDTMRAGVPFADAVAFHVPEFVDSMDEDVSDMFPLRELSVEDLHNLRDKLRQHALKPNESGNYQL